MEREGGLVISWSVRQRYVFFLICNQVYYRLTKWWSGLKRTYKRRHRDCAETKPNFDCVKPPFDDWWVTDLIVFFLNSMPFVQFKSRSDCVCGEKLQVWYIFVCFQATSSILERHSNLKKWLCLHSQKHHGKLFKNERVE